MFGKLVQLLLLAPAIASETNVSQLVEPQGSGAEKLTAAEASHVMTKQPSEDELPFMPVSWIQTGAEAQQAAEAAAGHRAQMFAGLERMQKNLETVEQAHEAIESLSEDHHKVAMITKLLGSVDLLERALDDLQTKHDSPDQVGASAAATASHASFIETGAEMEQTVQMGTRASAEAHRAKMIAGVTSLSKNIEAIEQTRDAISSLEAHEEQIPLIQQLTGAVSLLKDGLSELQTAQSTYAANA
jgi:molecular chaperone GrpE (heat shock protein)